MHKVRIKLAFAIFLSFAIICGCSPLVRPSNILETQTPSLVELGQTNLLFLSDRDGTMKWYTMDVAGSEVIEMKFANLPNHYSIRGISYIPSLHLFLANLVDNQEWSDFFLMDADGNIKSRITDDELDEGNFSYNSNLKKFAYVCGSTSLDICVVNFDGTDQKNLTESPSVELSPVWFHDEILFISSSSGVPALWLMKADGNNQRPLDQRSQAENSISISPLGDSIYVAREEKSNWEIFVLNKTGKNAKNLTNNPSNDTDPLLSPDGNYLVYRSDRDGGTDLYVMDVDGNKTVRLTTSPNDSENFYSWLPDSSRIIFSEKVNGTNDVFSVRPDGEGKVNLTQNPANDVGAFPYGYK